MVKNLRYILLLSFICICITDSIIEIPIKTVNVESNPKLGDIKINGHSIGIRNYKGKMGKIYLSNKIYICTIGLGSKKQRFDLILDTGSYEMWVPKVGSKDQYKMKHHYDPSKSDTAVNTRQPFNIRYGTGACSGYRYYDYVTYVGKKKFKMLFGAADQTVLQGNDGIIGLGHQYENIELSFIEMLKKGGITTSRAFSFKFERGIADGTPGKLLIGRHRDFQNSNCVKIGLDRNTIFWRGQVNGIALKNSRSQASSNRKYKFIFDTGTNINIIPMEYLRDMQNQINALNCQVSRLESYQAVVCGNRNDVPDLKLKIGGKTVTIPKEYNIFANEQGRYITSVFFAQGQQEYIIGSYLMMSYHTLHDKDTESMTFCPLNR